MPTTETNPPAADDASTPRVFISYCKEDRSVAYTVCAALENAGYPCWIAPRNVRPGENWGRSIIKSIAAARVMVLVFSRHTNESPHVMNEIERAVSHRMTVMPFRIENVEPSEDLELFISSRHWLDAFSPPLEPKLAELVAAVQGVLGAPTASAPAAAPVAAAAEQPLPPPVPAVTAVPARGLSKTPFIIAGAGVAALILAGVLFAIFAGRSKPETSEAPASPPRTTAETKVGAIGKKPPAAEPAATKPAEEPSRTTAAHEPPPTDENRKDQLLAKAKEFEDEQDFIAALGVYAGILKQTPQDADVRKHAENAIARLEEKADTLGSDERLLDALRRLSETKLGRGCTFLGGLLRKSDPEESVRLFKIAADQGDRRAMVEAGLMIASGQGLPRADYIEAATWFKKASDQGEPEGMRLYAECLLDGLGVPVNEAEAARLYSSAIALGDVPAKSKLAQLYRSGRGVPKRDLETAFRLFKEAADDGFLEAQGNLGVMYMNAESVPADPAKAVALWKDGAQRGDEICMFFYAMSLENGALGKPDLGAATEWYRKAARLGNPRAIDWCVQHGVTF